MKFWVILILPWLVMSLTWTWTSAEMGELIDTSFESCEPYHWVMKNRTIQWNGDSKHIVITATYKKPGSPIYTIYIVIDKCKDNNTCSGTPKIWVKELNCSVHNITESDKKICDFAEEIGRWELQYNWKMHLVIRFGLLPLEDIYKWICFYREDLSLSFVGFFNSSNSFDDDSFLYILDNSNDASDDSSSNNFNNESK